MESTLPFIQISHFWRKLKFEQGPSLLGCCLPISVSGGIILENNRKITFVKPSSAIIANSQQLATFSSTVPPEPNQNNFSVYKAPANKTWKSKKSLELNCTNSNGHKSQHRYPNPSRSSSKSTAPDSNCLNHWESIDYQIPSTEKTPPIQAKTSEVPTKNSYLYTLESPPRHLKPTISNQLMKLLKPPKEQPYPLKHRINIHRNILV